MRTELARGITIVLVLLVLLTVSTLVLLTVSTPARAQGAAGGQADSPSTSSPLLVLLVATDAPSKAREQRFIAELTLALDGVQVLGVDPGMPAFAEKPLAAQIVSVRDLLDRNHGVAATWLNTVSPELVLLHMVVLSSGRALVRLVEGNPQRHGFVTDLAMAARELLGTAFLFKPVPAEQARLARVVEKVREGAAPVREVLRPPRWTVMGRGVVTGGLAGFEGPSIQVGGGLAIERRLWQGLRGRVPLQAQGGPLGGDRTREIRSVVVSPGIGASYLWELGPVLLGPAVDLSATWTNLWVQATATSTQGFSLWSFRADVGPELRVPVGGNVSGFGSVSLGFSPLRKVLTLQSSGATIYASPFVSWQAAVGVVLDL